MIARNRPKTRPTSATPSPASTTSKASDTDRDAAWKRIKAAAKKYDVKASEKGWREIGED